MIFYGFVVFPLDVVKKPLSRRPFIQSVTTILENKIARLNNEKLKLEGDSLKSELLLHLSGVDLTTQSDFLLTESTSCIE